MENLDSNQAAAWSAEQLAAGKHLFAQHCQFVLGVAGLSQLPPGDLPEVAFVGRSNVGKSSLVNAITGRTTLAKTSNTPGRTQQLNFFNLAERLMLVDLPGYGYAKVSRSLVVEWTKLLKKYLAGRAQLQRVCLLVDARHGLKDSDFEMMELLDKTAVTYQIILTKADKIKVSEQKERVAETLKALKKHPAAFPEVALTSANKGTGIEELRAGLAEFARKG